MALESLRPPDEGVKVRMPDAQVLVDLDEPQLPSAIRMEAFPQHLQLVGTKRARRWIRNDLIMTIAMINS